MALGQREDHTVTISSDAPGEHYRRVSDEELLGLVGQGEAQ